MNEDTRRFAKALRPEACQGRLVAGVETAFMQHPPDLGTNTRFQPRSPVPRATVSCAVDSVFAASSGLGEGIAATGSISEAAIDRAIGARPASAVTRSAIARPNACG
jgi:hypothetical protein